VATLAGADTGVLLARGEAAEVDARWSFVGKKKAPRWLGHALDHRTGEVLAYVFGRREGHALLELKARLVPVGITRFYTEGWGAYQRHVAPARHEVGKHPTRQLEGKPLTLRTRSKRLVRKTLCFSKSTQMPELVIGLFLNRCELGVQG
jgi:insertion element IS1 protein InsB